MGGLSRLQISLETGQTMMAWWLNSGETTFVDVNGEAVLGEPGIGLVGPEFEFLVLFVEKIRVFHELGVRVGACSEDLEQRVFQTDVLQFEGHLFEVIGDLEPERGGVQIAGVRKSHNGRT